MDRQTDKPWQQISPIRRIPYPKLRNIFFLKNESNIDDIFIVIRW